MVHSKFSLFFILYSLFIFNIGSLSAQNCTVLEKNTIILPIYKSYMLPLSGKDDYSCIKDLLKNEDNKKCLRTYLKTINICKIDFYCDGDITYNEKTYVKNRSISAACKAAEEDGNGEYKCLSPIECLKDESLTEDELKTYRSKPVNFMEKKASTQGK